MDKENEPGGEELSQALRLLDHSQSYMRTIFLALSLQYRSLDLQRCQLLSQEGALDGPEARTVQTAAFLITLYALFGFQRQAEDLARAEAAAGGCPDETDVRLGAAVIAITLIRLARLQRLPAIRDAGNEEASVLEAEEELDEP